MNRDEADKTKTEADPEWIDRWLKDQLEPCPERVARMVRRTLATDASSPKAKVIWRPVPIAISLLIGAAVLSIFIIQFSFRHSVNPDKEGSAESEIIATITDKSGNIELQLYAQGKGSQSSSRQKQVPTARIFNQEGLMAAQIDDGRIRYIVIGGDQ
jgi:hypothetical protein